MVPLLISYVQDREPNLSVKSKIATIIIVTVSTCQKCEQSYKAGTFTTNSTQYRVARTILED